MKKMKGVITAMTTPFDSQDRVDVKALEEQVEFLIEKGVNCLYPCGTTGEMLNKMCIRDRALDSLYIRIYAGNFAQGDADPDGQKRRLLIDSMRRLGDLALDRGMKLVMENHFNTMTVSAADSISLAREIGHPAVGILYDQANLTFTGNESWPQALHLQFSKLYYTHVKDLIFREGCRDFTSSDVSHPTEEERNVITRIVGEGVVPWPEILQNMKDRGYCGWLSLEYERRWHPQDIPDASVGMKKSADYLRSCFCKLT